MLDRLRRRPEVPVLIAGGGINGAGLFRDLALQGVDASMIEVVSFGEERPVSMGSNERSYSMNRRVELK